MQDRLKPPEPKEIKALRLKVGLSQPRAASLLHVITRAYQRWEADPSNKTAHREMHPAYWELFQLKTSGQWDGFKIQEDMQTPTPDLLRATRTKHNLTLESCANLLHTGKVSVFHWESPESDKESHRKMPVGFWELLLYKLSQL